MSASDSVDAVRHLKALIACPSVTPADGGALDYLEGALGGLGFSVTRRVFSEPGADDVDNLFATIGRGAPHLVFTGHTDVVPPGNEVSWRHPPFAAEEEDGVVYGRGAVDMKGGIACFIAAAARRLARRNGGTGTISLLITGDEEGRAVNGTAKLLPWALGEGHRFDAALVGEPTSQDRVGDTFKTGRRGSLSGTLRISGRQGHSAYPHLADNPAPRMVRALAALDALAFDEGSPDFPPTNLEITAIETGNPAFNVTPDAIEARFNVRFNDRWTSETLKEHIAAAIAGAGEAGLDFLAPAAEAFLTRDEALIAAMKAAIADATSLDAEDSTGGGTSDARFFRDVCPVVECGLVGATMHQVDERVPIADLATLTDIYAAFLDRILAEAAA